MLSELKIRNARPETKTRILWDQQVKGLGVRITPKGTKAYVLDYRMNGRRHRVVLARTTEISLEEIRKRAGAERVRDPRRRGRSADAAARSACVTHGERGIGAVLRRICADAAGSGPHGSGYGGRLSPTSCPSPAARPGQAADRRHRAPRHRAHGGARSRRPPRCNATACWRSRAGCSGCSRIGRYAHSIRTLRGVSSARARKRVDRVLTPSEMKALGAALARAEKDKPAAVAAIRLAALTGLRIGEVLAMRWEHLDTEHHAVVLPHTKTGRRVHGLPVAALELLAGRPRINGYVFTTGRDAAITYQTVHAAFVAPGARGQPVGCTPARPAPHSDDERGASGGRHPRTTRPARAQDYGDGRPLHPACRCGGSRGPGAHRCGHRCAAAGRVTAPDTRRRPIR